MLRWLCISSLVITTVGASPNFAAGSTAAAVVSMDSVATNSTAQVNPIRFWLDRTPAEISQLLHLFPVFGDILALLSLVAAVAVTYLGMRSVSVVSTAILLAYISFFGQLGMYTLATALEFHWIRADPTSLTLTSPLVAVTYTLHVLGVLLGVLALVAYRRDREWDVFRKPRYPALARIGIGMIPAATAAYLMRLVVESIRVVLFSRIVSTTPPATFPALVPSVAYLAVLTMLGAAFIALVLPTTDKLRRIYLVNNIGISVGVVMLYAQAAYIILVYHGAHIRVLAIVLASCGAAFVVVASGVSLWWMHRHSAALGLAHASTSSL